MSSKRPISVITRCVADNYAASNERIIEFIDTAGHGGLISFRILNDDAGTLLVNVYNTDKNVKVVYHKSQKWRESIAV